MQGCEAEGGIQQRDVRGGGGVGVIRKRDCNCVKDKQKENECRKMANRGNALRSLTLNASVVSTTHVGPTEQMY